MNKHLSKFGTDARYPLWSGAVLDAKFFNGGTAVALLLNWGCLVWLVHHIKNQSDSVASLDPTTLFRFVFVFALCVSTSFLIRHSDRFIQWFTRAFACGIPLAIVTVLLMQRLTSGQ